MAIWDTFKWDIIRPAIYCYLSELFAIGLNSMLILIIQFINDPDTDLKYGLAYVAVFAALMALSSLSK